MTTLLAVVLGGIGTWVALPLLSDLWALFTPDRRPALPEEPPRPLPRLLFLTPAHNERLLIERCVRSLVAQDYPPEARRLVVIADNCTDETAAIARQCGAEALERTNVVARGKHHAIRWALEQVALEDYAAVVIIDADAVVNREFARSVARWPGLSERVLHTYDGLTNEFENWLTRLAGLLTRNRYDIALPLKARAGLGVPLTGDGMVLGTAVLRRDPWHVETITEGWELYARYATRGLQVGFEPRAIFFDQEAHTFSQGEAQRQRWASGRLQVLRMYLGPIFTAPGLRLHQRLDLLAELSAFGPVLRAVLSLAGAGLSWALLTDPSRTVVAALFLTGVVQPAAYSLVSLVRHPEPGPTLTAMLRLPGYAFWRLALAFKGLLPGGRPREWVRTARHEEK